MNALPDILSGGFDGPVVVLQGWPAQLTKDQLRAYTNWSARHIDDLTREGKIKGRRSGRAGATVWLRSSVDTYLETEFNEHEGADF